MTVPDLQAFHICFAVYEMEPWIERFRAILGADTWHIDQPRPNGTRPAYGRGAGQTWELWEAKGDGTTAFHEYLKKHGEGVQHIGFWAPDVRAAVEKALDGGAQLVSSSTDAQGNTAVQLLPKASVGEEHFARLGFTTFVEAGFGNVRIEYIGKAGEAFMHDWLGDKFSDLVEPPPWA